MIEKLMEGNLQVVPLTHAAEGAVGDHGAGQPTSMKRMMTRNDFIVHVGLGMPLFQLGLFWLAFLLLHGLCALYLLGSAVLYWLFTSPTLLYYVYMTGLLDPKYFMSVSVIHALLGAFHAYALVKMVVSSLRHRTFHFGTSTMHTLRTAVQNNSWAARVRSTVFSRAAYDIMVQRLSVVEKRARWCSLRVVIHGFRRCWMELHAMVLFFVGRYGVFRMESDWFDVSFILRELIEVCTQTSQAYNLSRLIARQSLNQGVVGLLVINCWSTPLVQSAFSHNPPLERVVCLTVNLVLAFASTVLVPLMLIVPYAFDFDFGAAVFPDELVYNEAWLVNVLMESQHALFVRDGGDMTMKTLAHLGIIINIVCLRSILRRRQTSKPINKVVLAASGSTGVTRSVAPADEFRAITQLGPSLVSLVHVPIFAKLRQKRWFRRVPRRLLIIGPVTQFTLICWGFAVLTCHTLALYSTATPPDHVRCSLSTRPWLVRSFTCAVVELNCHSLGTKGAADILDAALRQITSLSVFYVAFTLCPALEIPPAVSGLGNLKGIEIYNSTITKWPSKAAIRAEYHPFISVIYLVRVNMSELPKGLQHPDFPPSLMDIQMCSVNLTSLPSVVADLWPRHLTFLYWELSGLTEIPDVIGRFQIDRLSFAGNDIKEITPTIFSGQRLETFSVADNPSLSQLPPRVGDTSLMYQLQLDFTNISIIARRCNVSASATPLCVNNLSSSHGVGCKLVDRGTVSMYPLEIKDKQRRQLAW